jgi:hypothetical protein
MTVTSSRSSTTGELGEVEGLAEQFATVLDHLTAPAIHRGIDQQHGVAPGLTQRLAAVADRLLPSGDNGQRPVPRHAVETAQPAWVRAATGLARAAARRFHQYQDPI